MSSRTEQIAAAVERLDTVDTAAQDAAWANLRPLGFGVTGALRSAYKTFRTWQGRTALVFYATRYARVSEAAVELGLMALQDRSYMVRYRACGLLAYSLREDALPKLDALANSDKREFVRLNAQTAINAILAQDHHLWTNPTLSGGTSWRVNPGDIGLAERQPKPPDKELCQQLGLKPVTFTPS